MDLSFFLTFISAVAYLQRELGDLFDNLDFIEEVKAGAMGVICQRNWEIGGLPVQDMVRVDLDNQLYISGLVGHPFDFSTMVVYGWYDDSTEDYDNPKVGAYWVTEMIVWRPEDPWFGGMLTGLN